MFVDVVAALIDTGNSGIIEMINIPVVVVPYVTRSSVIFSVCIVPYGSEKFALEFSGHKQIISTDTPTDFHNNIFYGRCVIGGTLNSTASALLQDGKNSVQPKAYHTYCLPPFPCTLP